MEPFPSAAFGSGFDFPLPLFLHFEYACVDYHLRTDRVSGSAGFIRFFNKHLSFARPPWPNATVARIVPDRHPVGLPKMIP